MLHADKERCLPDDGGHLFFFCELLAVKAILLAAGYVGMGNFADTAQRSIGDES